VNRIDEIDRRVLNELTKDGQKPFLQIAKQMGVSARTVQQRYEKMKKEGVILRPTILIDLSKAGYQGKAYLMITEKSDQDMANTVDTLKEMPDVFLVAEIVGEFDVLAMVPFKDFNNIIELVNEIRMFPSVSEVEVALTSDTSFPITKYYSKMVLPKTEKLRKPRKQNLSEIFVARG
jgi:Lrp/AsnC family transcriptional regulator for asnA, asnC and gidA